MGFISAVEAWFVTVSSGDSIGANLKGNPGLHLQQAGRFFKIIMINFFGWLLLSLVHNTVCYAEIMEVIGSSASMRVPGNCHPLSRLLNFCTKISSMNFRFLKP